MDLISPVLRIDFREFCVNYFVLRNINDVFSVAGIKKGVLRTDRLLSGERRTLVEQYYSSLNWENEQDADKFLGVLGYAIAQSSLTAKDKNYLKEICEREGFVVDGINIYRTVKTKAPSVVVVKPSELARLRDELMAISKLDPQQRGYAFEKFLNELFWYSIWHHETHSRSSASR